MHAQSLELVSSPSVRPPTARFYQTSILKVLGKLTQNQAGVFVDKDMVVEHVLEDMGYDPKNLSQYGSPEQGWRLKGKPTPPSIDRQIGFGFRNLVKRAQAPLCVYGSKRGQWALTEAGVLALPKEEQPKAPTKNRTSKLLDERLKAPGGMRNSGLYKAMKTALQRKLPVSAATDQIDDHIQMYLQRLIHRDGLRDWLEAGNEVSNSRIASFAVRSAFTDCRDSARNPICRTLYGAKTEKELDAPDDIDHLWSSEVAKVAKVGEEDSLLFEVVDTMNPSIEEALMFRSIWAEIEETLQRRKPEKSEQYSQVLRLAVQGHSLKEIQEKMGVPENKANSLLSEARGLLKKVGSTRGFQSFDLPV